ncbi:polysaccharide lyase family 7 protein [Algibacillus agarilyticus]|uniref:polysaccharide lyase family 7 protein n=1 Tax=Algibacillus agarilyticus TaxID=2234133 RepID=UPI000DCFD8B6|nr:polysaccharide lyase family 7 protein [Algibacillus agarilyticus]
MSKLNKPTLKYCAASVLFALAAPLSAATVSIENAGFESSWDGWKDNDPSAISGDSNSGSKSAKISGSGGRIGQTVQLTQDTNYELTAYVKGSGQVGINLDGSVKYKNTESSDWTQVTVSFNSGSSTSGEILAKYYNDEGRFDDFALVSVDGGTDPEEPEQPEEPTDPTTVNCSGSAELDIVNASDNGTNDGHGPLNTIDNDLSDDSRWSSKGSGKTITYDLGELAKVKDLNVVWFKGNSRSSYFDVDTSTNNSDWTSVLVSGQSSGSSSSFETHGLSDTDARYVRITGHGNSSNTWNSIIEAKILGCTDGVTEPEQPEEPEEPQEPEQPPTGDAEYPSDLMSNFDQWKITYPDGEEVKQLYQESNEYFYVNDEGNGIVFYAPVRSNNGTTPNSSYIRSELRERTEDGSADVYWTTSGTHVVYAKQAITHLPIVKNHLVATQIHGDKEEGIDDSLVLRLEGSHLFLSFNGGKLRDNVTIKSDYELGTLHEVMFEVIDDKHYVYYSEDGKLAQAYAAGNASQYLVKDGSSDYLMDLSYGKSYFKIGNYTQSNSEKEGDETDNPENYGEVVVYDFWVNHE